MNSKSKTEGLPYDWEGKDMRWYKYTKRAVFRAHDLQDSAEVKLKRDGLISEESEARFDKKQFKIKRMIGATIASSRLQQVD
ncbi:hypothetical protein GN244_ATG09112 [Phytophthora infestans]|uniref:Uncharacterized protein n=1 Tax=Phytophthora infestans TaxID=4787 RepID=A0A833SRL9_PHYIN|nr:hypothetical protein GN244_ATG09112 [Phytophthora infestans]